MLEDDPGTFPPGQHRKKQLENVLHAMLENALRAPMHSLAGIVESHHEAGAEPRTSKQMEE